MRFLDQAFEADAVTPEQMDMLWDGGWRHFGTYFYRYELSMHRGRLHHVLPLRIVLSEFQPSRSQKRVLAKNRDLQVVIRDTQLNRARHELFLRHRERFDDNIPDSLYTFLSDEPNCVPCLNREINLYEHGRLLAVSFLDIGATATSGVYAMFEPEAEKRSLGIFMILKAIEYSQALGCTHYYPGYAYREPSIYDYKKNFTALESLDWESGWQAFSL
jgi:arginine-tRNA-protein transferase